MNTFYAIIALLLFFVLALNLVIRIYVVRLYRRLVKKEVDFLPKHFFNKKLLSEEVLPKYPEESEAIKSFIWWVRFSMTMASIILAIILYLGYFLLKTQS